MLDRKFIVENAAARASRTAAAAASKADVDRFVELETHRRQKQLEVERAQSPGQRGRARRSARPRTRPSAKPARRKAAGCASRCTAAQAELDRARRRGRRHLQRAFPTCRIPTLRSAADDQANLEVRRGKHAPPKFDFKPLDHVELGEKLDLIDFEGGREGRRARLLLPEERRRAAGAGPAALRPRPADAAKASRRRSRPTWPATKSCKASASFPAGRRRRSTASTTAT